MHIKLPYGSDLVPVDVPDNWINGRCYRPHPISACADEHAEFIAAIARLPEDQSLAALASGKTSCSVAVDGENPAIFPQLLPALVEAIEEETELQPGDITVVVANRLIAPFSEADLARLLPNGFSDRYKVVLHDPLASEDLDYVSRVQTGDIPLTLNRHYLSGEFKVVLGGVRPDLVLGFTGGRSVLLPGLAGEESLRALYTFENIRNENARFGNFQDNPFHLAGMEAAQLAGCDLCISATLTPSGQIHQVFAGAITKSHLQAMNSQRGDRMVTVKEPMDIVVTSGGGAPLDDTLIGLLETVSAMVPVLKPGGTVVISAALRKGVGPAEFTELIRTHSNLSEAIHSLSSHDSLYAGQWVALRLYRLLERHEIILFNQSLEESVIWSIGLTPARDLNEAVQEAMTAHGQGCKIVAFPDGPNGLGAVS